MGRGIWKSPCVERIWQVGAEQEARAGQWQSTEVLQVVLRLIPEECWVGRVSADLWRFPQLVVWKCHRSWICIFSRPDFPTTERPNRSLKEAAISLAVV
ncbi:hypothetical protein XELAEV_18022185mg [Xenopus laevis]|uniref:Uncharacterized protein n=1 Tax=Xenopus laevis TaxID=8355 RepID=A0A974HMY8_XENLA|nr:hypothetical protein XELAEV_18022185mg [Xenopus laevis]